MLAIKQVCFHFQPNSVSRYFRDGPPVALFKETYLDSFSAVSSAPCRSVSPAEIEHLEVFTQRFVWHGWRVQNSANMDRLWKCQGKLCKGDILITRLTDKTERFKDIAWEKHLLLWLSPLRETRNQAWTPSLPHSAHSLRSFRKAGVFNSALFQMHRLLTGVRLCIILHWPI